MMMTMMMMRIMCHKKSSPWTSRRILGADFFFNRMDFRVMLTFDDELESGFSFPTQQGRNKNFETLPTALSPITFSASVDFRCGFLPRMSPWIFPWICPWIFLWILPWVFLVLFRTVSRLFFFTFFSTAFFTPFSTADFRGGILKRMSSWVFWKFSCRPETRRGLVFPLPPTPPLSPSKVAW